MSHRMISNRITNTSTFLEMPTSAQALYFHLCLNADDDGVIDAYMMMKLTNSKIGDLKILNELGLIKFLNEQSLIIIWDWSEHNKIRPDRIVPSIYRKLIRERYPDRSLIQPKPRSDQKDNSKRLALDEPAEKEKELDSPWTVHGPSMDGVSKVKLSKELISSNKLNQVDKKNTNINITPKGDINNNIKISEYAAAVFKKFGIDEDQWVKYTDYTDEEIKKYAAVVDGKKEVNNPSGLFLYLLKNRRNVEDSKEVKELKKQKEQMEKQKITDYCSTCNIPENNENFFCSKHGKMWDFEKQDFVECKYCEVK